MGSNDELWKIIMGISLRTFFNFVMVLLIAEGFVYSYHFSYKLFGDIAYKPGVNETVAVAVPDGSSALEVADIVNDNGLVDSRYLIFARLYLGKYSTKIMAGTYTLAPSMTPDEICRVICGMQSEDTQ